MVDPQSLHTQLPAPPDLERRCTALAMLDAIMSPEWDYRYYSFNRRWDTKANERMGSMRDGCGDDYFILFFADGSAAIKGFAHECPALGGRLAIPGILDGIPPSFGRFTEEPAFGMDAVTFALWHADGRWSRSPSVGPSVIAVDGSGDMLSLLVEGPECYAAFARDYFEREISAEVVSRFFGLEPLSAGLAQLVCQDVDLAVLAEDIDEIGYPVAD